MVTWIVGRGALILYKAAWTESEDIANALDWALDHVARRSEEKLVPAYSERIAWRPNTRDAFRAGLERNGPQAVTDFFGKS